jgi:hypothetical protein
VSQSRFGRKMPLRPAFPLFATDRCSAVPARSAPVSLILFRLCADSWPPPKEWLELWLRLARVKNRSGSDVVSVKMQAAAPLWLFHVGVKLASRSEVA